MNKIDAFSKILLATQTINYLASLVNSSKIEMGALQSEMTLSISEQHNDCLLSVVEQLKPIMESLGEYVNGKDMVDELDETITEAAYDFVIHEKD